MAFHVPERRRITTGPLRSTEFDGNNGAFDLGRYFIIASDGGGWDHVSVSIFGGFRKNPSWDDMCKIKEIFWDEEDTVIQFHPPKSEYVNNHPYTLHLWRPNDPDVTIPLPLKEMV